MLSIKDQPIKQPYSADLSRPIPATAIITPAERVRTKMWQQHVSSPMGSDNELVAAQR